MPQLPAIKGLKTVGNINIYTRPHITNPDGSLSTVNSTSGGYDEGEVLYPGMDNTHLLSGEEAGKQYRQTGQHLGIFDTPDNADAYAQKLHEDYANHSLDVPLASSRRSVDPNQLATVLQGLLKSGPYVDTYAIK
jgi:hypothetical protein